MDDQRLFPRYARRSRQGVESDKGGGQEHGPQPNCFPIGYLINHPAILLIDELTDAVWASRMKLSSDLSSQ
jgi:hypothetical protein